MAATISFKILEAAGQYANKIEKGWLNIVNGQIVEQSDTLPSLVVGSDAESLPELEGSDKQVSWAISLREKAIAKLKLAGKAIPNWFYTESSAKVFIDNRDKF